MSEARAIPVSVIDARLKDLDTRIQELQQGILSLQVQRDIYRSLLDDAVPTAPISRYGTPANGTPPKADVTLTDQLLAYVAGHPGKISGEIADDLLAHGFDSGQNPRKNILTTLAFIAGKGRVRKEADGRHYATGHPVQQPSLLASEN